MFSSVAELCIKWTPVQDRELELVKKVSSLDSNMIKNKNYTRATKRPEVIIQIILTDEVRNI